MESMRQYKLIVLGMGLVATTILLKKRRSNTLQKESTVAANKPSRIESTRRYKPIILWICLVAITILLSMLVLINDINWDWREILIILSSLGLIALIILGYVFKWDWTGLSAYTPPNKEYQRGKTLWDWLAALAIPVAIAGGTAWFSNQQEQRSRSIAYNQQQDNILKTYLDNMSDLVISHNLRNSNDNDPVRDVARGQTIVAIQRLGTEDKESEDDIARNNKRKARLLESLHELKLINKDHLIIPMVAAWLHDTDMSATRSDLDNDDLRFVDINHAKLNNVQMDNIDLSCSGLDQTQLKYSILTSAKLHGTRLIGADLSSADLSNADLSKNSVPCSYGAGMGTNPNGAILVGANLSDAILDGADLHGARYNAKAVPTMDEQGNPVTIQPTKWPQGFNPQAHGAICVDCK
jgi:uncharacterized protein YjbI with pentapeptide repeats